METKRLKLYRILQNKLYRYFTFIWSIQTEVSRLGTDRSSMEALILTCLQAQLIAIQVHKADMPNQTRNDIIWEIKQISPKECRIDAKAD